MDIISILNLGAFGMISNITNCLLIVNIEVTQIPVRSNQNRGIGIEPVRIEQRLK